MDVDFHEADVGQLDTGADDDENDFPQETSENNDSVTGGMVLQEQGVSNDPRLDLQSAEVQAPKL